MNYQIVSKEEDLGRNILPEGVYDVEIVDVQEMQSKGGIDKDGNVKPKYPMAVVDMSVKLKDGRTRSMKDWVMLEGFMAWKFRHLCDSAGLLSLYEEGSITIDKILGKKAEILLKHKYVENEDGTKIKRSTVYDYTTKPKVQTSSYIPLGKDTEKSAKEKVQSIEDDEIQF